MDLSEGPDRVEVIGDGRDGGVGERLTLWLQDHRRQVRLVTAAVVVAVVVTGIGVAAGRWYLEGPRLPHMLMARSTADPTGVMNVRWDDGDGGRPASAVRIGVQGEVTLRGLPTAKSARTDVLAITGPGLDGAFPVPVTVPGEGVPTAVDGNFEIACHDVPLPVPADRYGVRVRVTDGGRRSVGVLPGGGLSTWLAAAVGQSCGSWLAKRDVEVTDVVSAVDPREPRANITLTVTNHGRHAVRLIPLDGSGFHTLIGDDRTPAGAGDVELAVAAGATSTVHTVVKVDDCAQVLSTLQIDGTGKDGRTTAERLGLVGTAAPAGTPEATAEGVHLYGDGIGPTGLVLSAQTAARVDDAKTALCGGLPEPSLSVDTHAARWDKGRHVLTLPLNVVVDSAKVRDLTLANAPETGTGVDQLTPQGARFAVEGGKATMTLTYRLTGTESCTSDRRPNLPELAVELHMATPAGLRTVPFRFTLSQPIMPEQPGGACA